MWELDNKEGWALKDWRFWTVVLEKTLESPLDYKKMQLIILKEISHEYSLEGLMWSWGSYSLATWCEELTYLKRPWCRETLEAGGEEEDREWDGWMAWPIQWKCLSKLWEMVKDRETWGAAVHGITKNHTWLSDWTTTKTLQLGLP